MDRRKLEQLYYLIVENISFASDEIGDPTNGRTSLTAWVQDAEVIFRGKLKHILVFALMAFDVAQVAVNELFTIVPEREFLNVENLGAVDIVDVISLDPADGQGIVLDNDLTFMAHLTNNFRFGWSDVKNIIIQQKAVPTNKSLYKGTVLESLAYAYQIHTTGNAVVYTLHDFALSDPAKQLNKGVQWLDINGSSGPVELEKAHVTLGNMILGVFA
jgi:hypothetical protein